MKTLRYDQPDFGRAVAEACAASSLFDPQIEERVREIITEVRHRGDDAILGYTKQFDGVRTKSVPMEVASPLPVVPTVLRQAIEASLENITAFARRGMPKDWRIRNAQGGTVGEKYDPLNRVGIYIPGGTAPLVSSVLMTVGLAKAAGCPEIVVCTPPHKSLRGMLNPNLLYALRKAGATEIYRVGGAHAIVAMALGTQTIRRVQKVFGPGNAYVTTAKRLLFGQVGVDLLAGPSELMVLADDTAKPSFIAADMIAQAEHGTGEERVWLVTTSERVFEKTQQEIDARLTSQKFGLLRRGLAQRSVNKFGVCVLVKDLDQAVDVTNQFAPEHLEIMTAKASKVVSRINTAGAIFMGPWSPTVVGDYLAGPSHELPTGGAGAMFAGLTVDQFMRRTSVVRLSRRALQNSLTYVEAFGRAENLDAHVASARIRFS